MEHQQAQQQQQYLTLEGLENSNARAVFVKLINVLLTVLQVSYVYFEFRKLIENNKNTVYIFIHAYSGLQIQAL